MIKEASSVRNHQKCNTWGQTQYRDGNAAINILRIALEILARGKTTGGHLESSACLRQSGDNGKST